MEIALIGNRGAGYRRQFRSRLARRNDESVINLDSGLYPAISAISPSLKGDARLYSCAATSVTGTGLHLLSTHRPRAVVNFAAESHVDRSIHGPADFIAQCRRHITLLDAVRAPLEGAGN